MILCVALTVGWTVLSLGIVLQLVGREHGGPLVTDLIRPALMVYAVVMGAATSTVLYDSSTNWLTDLPILAGSVMTIAVPSWRVALWSD